MTTHQESKVVTRYEVWCDDCPWTDEYADPHEATAIRLAHEKVCTKRPKEATAPARPRPRRVPR